MSRASLAQPLGGRSSAQGLTARCRARKTLAVSALPWQISGSYLEACNCEAICPCRRTGGRAGGRSTYGECLGALSWLVEEGRAGDVDLAGLRTVLVSRYHDDEPRSPWTFSLFVDARGDERQRAALSDIFTGRLGGTPAKQFPWVFKPAHLVSVEPVDIEIDHTPGSGWFRAGANVTVRVREPMADQEAVTCVIPGHHRTGRELISDTIDVGAGPLQFSVQGRCAYESSFAYASDDD
jgi:hypothetical protein